MSHFTKSEIEEIAQRIMSLTRRDSEFSDATIPLDNTEKVPLIQYIPLLQDYENRLLSLADLRNLVLGDVDQTSIGCLLTVNCSTTGNTIKVKSKRGEVSGSSSMSYAAFYGEVVTVTVSADGYDTWYESVTMTQDHTLVIALNKTGKGGSGGGGGDDTDTYYVCVKNNQGATITLSTGGSSINVASNEKRWFAKGSRIEISVTKQGYNPDGDTILSLTSNYEREFNLTSSATPEERYLRFKDISLTVPAAGGTITSAVQSNVTWAISSGQPQKSSDDAGSSAGTSSIAGSVNINQGDTSSVPINSGEGNKDGLTYTSSDPSVASVDNSGNVSGQSAGTATIKITDSNGNYRGQAQANVSGQSGAVEPTGIEMSVHTWWYTYLSGSGQLTATVKPEGATNKTIIWESSDTDIARVTENGTIYFSKVKDGWVNITAYTYDRRYSDTCRLQVTAQGTRIDSVFPDPLNVGYEAARERLTIATTDLNGVASNVHCSGASNGLSCKLDYDNGEYYLNIPRNNGNARTFTVGITGLHVNTERITVNQAACEEISGFYNNHDSASVPAQGVMYNTLTGEYFSRVAINFKCAIDNEATIIRNTTCDSWISLGSPVLSDIYSGYSASQVKEYSEHGTINGVDPHFEGVVAEYSISATIKDNTGAARTGRIRFPGGTFTITQASGQ